MNSTCSIRCGPRASPNTVADRSRLLFELGLNALKSNSIFFRARIRDQFMFLGNRGRFHFLELAQQPVHDLPKVSFI